MTRFFRAAISQQHPARPVTASNLPAKPDQGDISWIADDFQPQVYSVQDALANLREVNHPDILNRPDAFVQMRLDLNMKTEKAVRLFGLLDLLWGALDECLMPPIASLGRVLDSRMGGALSRHFADTYVIDVSFQTKFLTDMSKVVVFPHPYPHTEKRLILAFAKDIKQQTAAAEAGAEIVGGPELVKKVRHSGSFSLQ